MIPATTPSPTISMVNAASERGQPRRTRYGGTGLQQRGQQQRDDHRDDDDRDVRGGVEQHVEAGDDDDEPPGPGRRRPQAVRDAGLRGASRPAPVISRRVRSPGRCGRPPAGGPLTPPGPAVVDVGCAGLGAAQRGARGAVVVGRRRRARRLVVVRDPDDVDRLGVAVARGRPVVGPATRAGRARGRRGCVRAPGR